MENSALGRSRFKLGANIPQHHLMRTLLGSLDTHQTKGTQTDADFCFCGSRTASRTNVAAAARGWSAARGKFEAAIGRFGGRPPAGDLLDLVASFRKRIQRYEEEKKSVTTEASDIEYDDWSDCQSVCTECEINFPRETRAAIRLQQNASTIPPPPPPLRTNITIPTRYMRPTK